ncbi:MAG: S9 family peptidase [Prevotellaceae bacterium]|nr:S9 family peptidase [Prevotellaceae bacterium]
MRKTLLLLFLGFATFGAALAQTPVLTMQDVAGGKYFPETVRGIRPSEGETFTQLSSDGRQIVRKSFRTGEQIEVLFDCSTARGPKKLQRIDGYDISPDGRRILLQTETRPRYRHSFTAQYYIFDVPNQKFEPLSDGGAQEQPLFSPDGTMIAFVRDNDLYIVKLLFGNAETRVTTDGERNKVINGLPDWVCEEEFSQSRAFDFSADSRTLAWVRYDESRVPVYRIPMYKGLAPELAEYDEYPGEYAYKYPVAGARNSEVSVLAYDVKDRTTRRMDVPMDSDAYIPRIHFTSDPERLAVVTLNRRQNCMDILMANPRSGVCRLAVREESDKYVKETAYESLHFYKDRFTMVSDRSGSRQLYIYTLSGTLERQATKGPDEVTAFYGMDEVTGRVFYQATDGSPLRRAVFVADKRGHATKLSARPGTNSATFSSNFRYYVEVHSSLDEVPVTTLRSVDGKAVATLVDNAALRASLEGKLGTKEFFTFTTSEGVALNGYMIKPRDFDASKRYPVVMYQYGGPGSQEVKDAWNIGFYTGGVFESLLCEKGFIVACVDGRGTGFRGADFEKCIYLHMGEFESRDQVEAALYLGSLPYVDKARIGIWGWSFGGFNTLMSMSEGRGVFAAGVAVAAPSNWKYYDTVYTERYMRTPRENPAGYADQPLGRAARLSGSLLLVHGTADDNVHFRNFAEMSEALVQADKQFDMHVYTNRDHSIHGGRTRKHIMTRIVDFFVDKLARPAVR